MLVASWGNFKKLWGQNYKYCVQNLKYPSEKSKHLYQGSSAIGSAQFTLNVWLFTQIHTANSWFVRYQYFLVGCETDLCHLDLQMVAEKIERGALILMFYALSLCYNVNWELLLVPNEIWILQCLHSQATITQDNEDDYNYCTYDSDISTGFGVGAFLLFMASQVIIMVASQCFCCGKALRPVGSRTWAILLFIICWYVPILKH